jgi:hypothetical protein
LAGRSSDENIDSCIRPILEGVHVAEVRDMGVMVREDRSRERLDLGEA